MKVTVTSHLSVCYKHDTVSKLLKFFHLGIHVVQMIISLNFVFVSSVNVHPKIIVFVHTVLQVNVASDQVLHLLVVQRKDN